MNASCARIDRTHIGRNALSAISPCSDPPARCTLNPAHHPNHGRRWPDCLRSRAPVAPRVGDLLEGRSDRGCHRTRNRALEAACPNAASSATDRRPRRPPADARYWPILGSRRGTAVAQIAAPDAGARRPRERTDRNLGVRRCVGYNLGHGQSRWMVTRAALGGYSPAVFRLRGRLGSGERHWWVREVEVEPDAIPQADAVDHDRIGIARVGRKGVTFDPQHPEAAALIEAQVADVGGAGRHQDPGASPPSSFRQAGLHQRPTDPVALEARRRPPTR